MTRPMPCLRPPAAMATKPDAVATSISYRSLGPVVVCAEPGTAASIAATAATETKRRVERILPSLLRRMPPRMMRPILVSVWLSYMRGRGERQVRWVTAVQPPPLWGRQRDLPACWLVAAVGVGFRPEAVVQEGTVTLIQLRLAALRQGCVSFSHQGRRRSGRPADGQPAHEQGRLADARGDALAALAADADTLVDRHVIADAGDFRQHARPVADQRCALDRCAQFAVLDLVRLGAGKDELARHDVDLSAAEAFGEDAVLDAAEQFGGIVASPPHEGVGHPRHRRVGETLAASVAGGFDPHQARVEAVLHIALQNTVLDQHQIGRAHV